MNKNIRAVVVVLLMYLMTSFCANLAMALEMRYTHIAQFSGSASISGNTISYSGVGCGNASNTRTKLVVTLERKYSTGSSWSDVETHIVYGTGKIPVGYTGTATAQKNYSYRVKVECNIYDAAGNLLESDSDTSNIVSY